MKTLYADGISDIAIINNVVRLDLFRLEPDRTSGDGQPAVRQVHETTLALPLDGLLGSLDLLDRVRADLLQGTDRQAHAKLVPSASPATGGAVSPRGHVDAAQPVPERSPNFV